jgi:hypothetical protein
VPCRITVKFRVDSSTIVCISIQNPKSKIQNVRGPATKSSTLLNQILLPQKKMATTKSKSRTRGASSSSSAPPAKRQKITVAPFAATFPRRTLLSSSRWVNKVPHDIWVYKIFQPFLDLKALSTPLQYILWGVLAICIEAKRDSCAGRVPHHESSD